MKLAKSTAFTRTSMGHLMITSLFVAAVASSSAAQPPDPPKYIRYDLSGPVADLFPKLNDHALEIPGAISDDLAGYFSGWIGLKSLTHELEVIDNLERSMKYVTDLDLFFASEGFPICGDLDFQTLDRLFEESRQGVDLLARESIRFGKNFEKGYILTLSGSSLDTLTDVSVDEAGLGSVQEQRRARQPRSHREDYRNIGSLQQLPSELECFRTTDSTPDTPLSQKVQEALNLSVRPPQRGLNAVRQLQQESEKIKVLGRALTEVTLLRLAMQLESDFEVRWQTLMPLHQETQSCASALVEKTTSAAEALRERGFDPGRLEAQLSRILNVNPQRPEVFDNLRRWRQEQQDSPAGVEESLAEMASDLRIRLSTKRVGWSQIQRLAELESRLGGY